MNLSKGGLPSPVEDGWGRIQATDRGVEEVDQGNVGIVGEKIVGVARTRRAMPRNNV